MSRCDVAVVGAGPYGLSAAAHLSAIKGLDVRAFGEPMEFWKSNMPEGMFLRSTLVASSLSDPRRSMRMEDFFAEHRAAPQVPIPLDRFVEYGTWFQRKAVPGLDRRRVRVVENEASGFRLTLADGESLRAGRVVVAGGIGPFALRPAVFAGLPGVSHVSDGRDVARFHGKRVVVIGGGQSAMETAALVHEAGAHVEVLVRNGGVRWHGHTGYAKKVSDSFISKLLHAPAGVGPAGLSRIVAAPLALKLFPRFLQDRIRERTLRPTALKGLMERMSSVTISQGRVVVAAKADSGRLMLDLDDGSVRRADHVLLGTGYKIDVSRYAFLAPELLSRIRTQDGFPRLSAGFESSVPGLHFIGAAAGWSYGPLMYFVAGTEFAAGELARRVARRAKAN
ncbi:MAG TPA: FAD-dependent oxidoreductase [Elusimicrobiota bacterium]|nr:FAD-dependent oxidoreductase [Elusimicrobiota bacterium]